MIFQVIAVFAGGTFYGAALFIGSGTSVSGTRTMLPWVAGRA